MGNEPSGSNNSGLNNTSGKDVFGTLDYLPYAIDYVKEYYTERFERIENKRKELEEMEDNLGPNPNEGLPWKEQPPDHVKYDEEFSRFAQAQAELRVELARQLNFQTGGDYIVYFEADHEPEVSAGEGVPGFVVGLKNGELNLRPTYYSLEPTIRF